MSSTCLEPEDSPLVRRLYVQVWYSVFYMHINSLVGRRVLDADA